MDKRTTKILLIDDEREAFLITRRLFNELSGADFQLDWVESYELGREAMAKGDCDVYLVDNQLGAQDGLQLIREGIAAGCQAPMIVLTGRDDPELDRRSMQAGAVDYLVKDGLDATHLERAIRYAVDRCALIAALKNSEAVYSSLVEHVPLCFLRKDRVGHFTFANSAFCEVVGKRLDEIIGKTDFDFYPEKLAEKYRRDDQRVLETGDLFVDVEENQQDGQTRYVEVLKTPVRDATEQIVGTQAMFWDVTEKKQAEDALRESQERMRLIVDTSLDAFVAMNEAGCIVDWNTQAEKTFGWTKQEVLDQLLAETILPERYRAAHNLGIERFPGAAASGFLNKRIEITALHRDGHEFPVEMTIAPIRRDHTYIFSAFIHDITERKRSEQALKEAKEAAEAANRAKSDFLANMSHEIRTPMNAVLGMTELLLQSELIGSQRDYLATIRDSGESLLMLINDILDFSKIEAERCELENIVFSLRDSLGDTMKLLSLRAEHEALELAFRVRPDVPDRLVGDPFRLRQIVINLVGNAIKFTESGEVVLDVEIAPPAIAQETQSRLDDQRSSETGSHGHDPVSPARSETAGMETDDVLLHLSIRDTGVGIPKEKQKLIFQAFEQVDTSMSRRYAGAGLGLAISSRLVQLMNGTIWLESALGQGSQFHFTACFGRSNEPAAAGLTDRSVARLQGLPVLVVDDNETNRCILGEILRNWSMQPTLASNASEALELLERAHRADAPFSLALVDVQMPDVDGFMLVEQIQQNQDYESLVVMLLTSGDRAAAAARSKELGVAAALLKPIKQSELFNAIIVALGVSRPAEPAVANAEGRRRLKPLKILLAEDSVPNQKLAIGLLEKWGHTVTVANNGQEAVDAWAGGDFEMILMDLQMPQMDGLEATRFIRQREAETGAHVPIIAMTAHVMPSDREKCLQAGMDAFVAKPVRFHELDDAMRQFVDESDTVAVATPFDSTVPSTCLDWNVALKSVQGDRELLKSVAEAFLEECPMLMEQIVTSIDENDAKTLRRAAHTVKGTMRTFGAERATDVAYQMETLASNGLVDQAAELFDMLKEETDKVIHEVRSSLFPP